MKEIHIRPAVLSDLGILLGFEQGVIDAERPIDPTLKQGSITYYDIEEMLLSDNIFLAVATENNVIVGSGYAKIQESKPYLAHDLFAYLGFMYVKPSHRGKGIVLKIISALEEWADSKGVREIRLDVYSTNDPALRAYQKAGFSSHLVLMRKDLNTSKQ